MSVVRDEAAPAAPTSGSAGKDRLLSLLLAAERRRQQATTGIVAIEQRSGPLPLSSAQERLWFLNELGLMGSAYNLTMALRLEGDLDIGALERSFSELVRRHESLRTRFGVQDGVPYQLIDPAGSAQVFQQDVSDVLDPERREIALRERIERERLRQFDLRQGPLLRMALIRLDARQNVLLLTMHHIVSDGWSLAVLNRELSALYAAHSQGKPCSLPQAAIQYADYAAWQRKWLQGEAMREQLQYWKDRLVGAAPHLELPTDRPRPVMESFNGGTLRFELPPSLARQMKELGRREGATLFMVALAAYQLLLARWSGQQDIVVGTPIAGRKYREVEELIGFFVNVLAFRTEVSDPLTFRQLLARVKAVTLGAYAHQDLPFEALVKELRPERSLSSQPIFQVMLVLQNFPEVSLELPGLTWKWLDTGEVSTHVDLTLYLYETPAGLSGIFLYASDLFDARTIERMKQQFTILLQGIAADPDCEVHRLALLGEDEKHRLLVEWNDIAGSYASSRLVHELFEEQVALRPNALALVFEERSLTYAQLNRCANQLARHLQEKGVSADRLVALYVERSTDMIVAMLGVLKAGGAYIPLDPANQTERLVHALTDARPTVVLTQERLKSKLPPVAAEVITLDSDWESIEQQCGDNLGPSPLSPQHLAYVIYTSGSTGTPKGVMIQHRNIVNYSMHAIRELDAASGNGSLVCTSISFDLMLTGLYPTLLCGQTVRLCPEEMGLPSLEQEVLKSTDLGPLKLTPSHLALLDDALRKGLLAGRVGVLVVGGESLQSGAVQLWRTHAPGTRIFNHYGPTETTVGCVMGEIEQNVSGPIPLGRPIANTQVFVLNRHLQPVPIGAVGEIYIGGAGVARGYLNRPELTAERFVAGPFSGDSRARLYRTGDLGRWRSSGVIEYLGRNDHQVKIRGYRIELGEIEAQLMRHPKVKAAVVVPREDPPGEKRLVGYVVLDVPTAATDPNAGELRAYLKSVLPEYMVPSAFVAMERLPLTPNGKVDRRALPAPEPDSRASRKYEAPRSDVERALADIWQELLNVERVGRDENFFELGGHSLLGVKLIARIAAQLKVNLSVISVFKTPTIALLADVVESLQFINGDPQTTGASEFEPRASSDRVPLTFSQLAHWHRYRLGEKPAIRQIASATRLRGRLNVAALRKSLAAVVIRHEALRTRILTVDHVPVQAISDSGNDELTIDDLMAAPEHSREARVLQIIDEHILEPVDIAAGPLFGARLAKLDHDEHVLILAMEHIISDASSMNILLRDLFAAYAQAARGEAIMLPPIPMQFADYAAWQRSNQQSWMQNHAANWGERITGSRPLRFPADQIMTSRVGSGAMPIHIDREMKARLQEWSRSKRATLPMTLFAAYAALVLRWCGTTQGVILYVIDGRITPKVANTIGCFASALYLRVELLENDTFEKLVDRVMAEFGEAHEHADFSHSLAQQSAPEFTKNPAFNWIPQRSEDHAHRVDRSSDGIDCTPIRFTHPMIETLELDREPGISLYDGEEGIDGSLVFSLNRFSSEAMARFTHDYLVFLQALLGQPESRANELPPERAVTPRTS